MPQLYSLLTGSIYLPDGSVSSSRGFSGSFYGNGSGLTGITTASYVEYINVKNRPTIISGSIQVDHNATTNYTSNTSLCASIATCLHSFSRNLVDVEKDHSGVRSHTTKL